MEDLTSTTIPYGTRMELYYRIADYPRCRFLKLLKHLPAIRTRPRTAHLKPRRVHDSKAGSISAYVVSVRSSSSNHVRRTA
jgi:hypothetical protein